MAAAKFIAKRLAEFVVSIAVLSFVVFSLLFLSPGDPARVLVGTKSVNPDLLASIRAEYHLDDPFFSQYFRWLGNALHGDFGQSIKTEVPVTEMIGPYLKITVELVLFSLILALIIGLLLGVIAAKRRGTKLDGAINAFALLGTSAPSFAVGLLLLYVFAYLLGWFPIYGSGDGGFLDTINHLTLPAISLTFVVCAMLIQITRSSMLGQIDKDYAIFMQARGVKPLRITTAQLRNASGPILTSIGLLLANLFGATILIETTFALPGLGNLLASSVTMKDVPVVQFVTMVLAVMICLSSAVVDIAVYFADPQSRSFKRLKLGAES
ncbi:MAG: ABC transporter permease [Clostridiales Family XIII bacterium]|jgi:peptide/nickel transport system permease protein|nr:ABC transporter permease [Clostridiales Family XIII bacterium]